MEQIIFYLLMFVIGTGFGNFFTVMLYRTPSQPSITYKHSYCPNCNHKLSFWDRIPILSYFMLRGKCRYCKHKIGMHYLFLEILMGSLFALLAMSLNFKFHTFEMSKAVYFLFAILYIIGIILIAGIDKEKRQVKKSLLLYEVVVISVYKMYQYMVEKINIDGYIIYLFLIGMFFLVENLLLKKKLKDYYPLEILELSIIMTMFSNEIEFVFTVILTLLMIVIGKIVKWTKEKMNKVVKKEKSYYQNLPIGFYLCLANIFIIFMINWLACRK